jgi:fatty acid CoA ligase FadD36
MMGAMRLLAALLDGALDDPEAIRVGDTAMTGPELLGAAAVVADQIGERPVEGPVAVLAEPTAQTVVAMVGALLAGAPVVPVPPDTGPGERAHVLSDSGATLWIGERPPEVTLPVRRVDLTRRSGDVAREANHDGPALVLYTSGTTGPPKGVLLSRAAMAAGLDGLADAWDWTAHDTLAHGLPLFHVHGLVLGVFGALRVGSPLVHVGRSPTPTRPRSATAVRPCSSACRRCGPASPPTPTPRRHSVRRGCSSRAARRCPCRCSSGCASSPGRRPSSATG